MLCWCTRLRGRVRLGGRVQSSEKEWYSVTIVQNATGLAGRRRRHNQASHPRRRTGDSRWPFVRGRSDTEAGNDPMSRGWCMSLPSRRTKGVGGLIGSRTRPGGAGAADFAATDGYLLLDKANSPRPLRATSPRRRPRSWPTRKFRGAWGR